MKLTEYYVHTYRGHWSEGKRRGGRRGERRGKSRIRYYEGAAGGHIVIATEMPESKEASITSMAEYLAAEIMEAHVIEGVFLSFEHQSQEHFDRVFFDSWEIQDVLLGGVWPKKIGDSEWRSLGRKQVQEIISPEVLD